MNPPPITPSIPPQKCGLAITSLVLGIIGIVLCLGPVAGIPAVICGHLALSRIRNSGGALSGQGLATAGLVTGYFSLVWILMIGLVAAIAIPNFIKARQTAECLACSANLQIIQEAKKNWALAEKKGDNDVPTDSDLFGPDKSVYARPTCPAGGIYSLNAVAEKPACSIPGHELKN